MIDYFEVAEKNFSVFLVVVVVECLRLRDMPMIMMPMAMLIIMNHNEMIVVLAERIG